MSDSSARRVPEARIKRLTCSAVLADVEAQHKSEDAIAVAVIEQAAVEIARQLMAYRKVLVTRVPREPWDTTGFTRYQFALDVIVPPAPKED